MSWISRATVLFDQIFRRRRSDRDLDAEVGAYFEEVVDRYVERGMSREEARKAARLKFEGPEQVKQNVREAQTGAVMEGTFRDVRYAARMLRKKPGFATVAIFSLALGLGATSAMYSIADALLLRPLSVPKPEGVIAISPVTDQMFPGLSGISYPDYAQFRDHNRTFEGLIATSFSSFGFAPNRENVPKMKYGMFVSGNFFKVLGVEPQLGRGFLPEEDEGQGRDTVVVLSHELWVSQYGGSVSAIGQKLWLNGIEFTVLGVTPESFSGTDQFVRPALYVPFALSPRMGAVNNLEDRQVRWLAVKGRLKQGVTIAQAQSDIDGLTNELQKTYPKTDGSLRMKVETQLQFQTNYAPQRTVFIAMLGLLAVSVLLVACTNVAGLLLSRSATRAREIAVRIAVGAGRLSLIRQLLIENLFLALGGGIAGLGIAYAAVKSFTSIPLPSDLPVKLDMQVDTRVLLFTFGASIVTTLLFGLAPALISTRPDLVPALKAADAMTSKTGKPWGRNLLVAGQLAISLVLLVVSAVLVQGFQAEIVRGPGFRTDRLFVASLNTSLLRYADAQTELFYKQLLDKTRLAPDVNSATLASSIPISMGASQLGVVPEGHQLELGQEAITIFDNVVSDNYFDLMRIPIVRGRSFAESDNKDAPAVAVVNEQFAHDYWPNQDALGKRFHLRTESGKLVEIVGVARTTKYLSISEAPLDFVYLPFAQNQQPQMTLIAEAKSPDAAALAPVLRQVVQEMDRDMPVFDARTMHDIYTNRAVKTPLLIDGIISALGAMGLLLAAVGLYGLVTYSVSRRTREIGIRMALGANPFSVLKMVLKEGLGLGIAGVAVGLVIGVQLCRALTHTAFLSIGELSMVPFAVVSLFLLFIAMAATYLPARRASRIDPLRALREE
jgi:putative ABC transport system permease protein